jgi:xylan 1,4-beta-xylosidase
LYLTNGNQQVIVQLYSGFDNGKKIIFKMDTAVRSISNTIGSVVWLKLQRIEHSLTAYCSADGEKWVSLGAPINSVALDKVQPNYNSWVGTSVGLFAEGKPADFDFFVCKDGFTALPAQGYSNYYGVATLKNGNEKTVTNTSNNGGWFMISGVDLGSDKKAVKVEVLASSAKGGKIEIWLDDLKGGRKIATIPVSKTNSDSWKSFSSNVTNVSGHHDVFVKFPAGSPQSAFIKSIRFAH